MTTQIKISESSFTSSVIELAQPRGWLVHHQRPAMLKNGEYRSAIEGNKGFPDLVLVRGARLIVAELKSNTGRLSPEQTAWLDAMRLIPGVEVYVWRPDFWDFIVDCLGRR